MTPRTINFPQVAAGLRACCLPNSDLRSPNYEPSLQGRLPLHHTITTDRHGDLPLRIALAATLS